MLDASVRIRTAPFAKIATRKAPRVRDSPGPPAMGRNFIELQLVVRLCALRKSQPPPGASVTRPLTSACVSRPRPASAVLFFFAAPDGGSIPGIVLLVVFWRAAPLALAPAWRPILTSQQPADAQVVASTWLPSDPQVPLGAAFPQDVIAPRPPISLRCKVRFICLFVS